MILRELQTPQVAGGIEQSAPITDKKGYGSRWQASVRTVDNWLKAGMPHLKIGARRVRIDIPQADQWMHDRFSVQRRGKLTT